MEVRKWKYMLRVSSWFPFFPLGVQELNLVVTKSMFIMRNEKEEEESEEMEPV